MASWLWNLGCGILAVESRPWNCGCGILAEASRLWNPSTQHDDTASASAQLQPIPPLPCSTPPGFDHGGAAATTASDKPSVEDMFQQMLSGMDQVKSEVAQVRKEIVTRSEFESYKAEVNARIESVSVAGDSNLKFQVQKQARMLDKLDTAHQTICLTGFALDMSADARIAEINNWMQQNLTSIAQQVREIKALFAGPAGNRRLSDKTLVEFHTPAARNEALSLISSKKLVFNCQSKVITFAKAKTQKQLDRNAVMRMALDKVKAHSAAKGKHCDIEWKAPGTWDRYVKCDNDIVFIQKGGEPVGSFVGAFSSLSLG